LTRLVGKTALESAEQFPDLCRNTHAALTISQKLYDPPIWAYVVVSETWSVGLMFSGRPNHR
jgi:hypothetical protein